MKRPTRRGRSRVWSCACELRSNGTLCGPKVATQCGGEWLLSSTVVLFIEGHFVGASGRRSWRSMNVLAHYGIFDICALGRR